MRVNLILNFNILLAHTMKATVDFRKNNADLLARMTTVQMEAASPVINPDLNVVECSCCRENV